MKRKKPITKKPSYKKINLLKKKKNLSDKFNDVYKKETLPIFKENKRGELIYKGVEGKKDVTNRSLKSFRVLRKKNIKARKNNEGVERKIKELEDRLKNEFSLKELIKKIGVSKNEFNLFVKGKNVIPKKDIRKNINNLHKGIIKEKEESKIFYKHTFTFDNYFKAPVLRNLKYSWSRKTTTESKRKKIFKQQFYFRAGLKVVFRSKSSGVFEVIDGKKEQIYVIQNHPVSSYYFEPFSKGWKQFFDLIKDHVNGFDSILLFSFNYFDVTILDL